MQLVTVRYLGCFLADPLAVPTEVVDVVAGQLGIADPSCVKRYTEREKTRLDHVWEIQQAFGLRDFASCEVELTAKLHAHASGLRCQGRLRARTAPGRRGRCCGLGGTTEREVPGTHLITSR